VNVGSFSPWTDSRFGVADMMGSIFEWTHSLSASYPYDAHDGREKLKVEGKRVIRGYFDSPKQRFSVRSARRHCLTPDKKAPVLGFRVVVAPPIL
jgi:formylglycine-generating enzyme required for sulfatase activity